MTIKTIRDNDGSLKHHIVGADSWDDFESLAKYLEKSFGAQVVKKLTASVLVRGYLTSKVRQS